MMAAPEMVGGTRDASDTRIMRARPGCSFPRVAPRDCAAWASWRARVARRLRRPGSRVKIEDGDRGARANKSVSVEALRPAGRLRRRRTRAAERVPSAAVARSAWRRDRHDRPDVPAGAVLRAGLSRGRQDAAADRSLSRAGRVARRDRRRDQGRSPQAGQALPPRRGRRDRDGSVPARPGGLSRPVRPAAAQGVGSGKHAPGPVRADQPASSRRATPPAPASRRPSREPSPAETAAAATADRVASAPDPRTRPRSSRAYTWSASEVPWWEEARAASKPPAEQAAGRAEQEAGTAGSAERPASRARRRAADEPRSSTSRISTSTTARAARRGRWPRAPISARARQDLPRRGSFRHAGHAGRHRGPGALAAAEAEARRRAAAAAACRGQHGRRLRHARSATAHTPGRTRARRTSSDARSAAPLADACGQRLAYALIAWLPDRGGYRRGCSSTDIGD